MPLSRYLKIFPCPYRAGSYLLYSTRKGSLVRISSAMLAAAQHGTISPEDRVALSRLALWTDDPVAERATLAGLVQQSNIRSRRFEATVVLTMDCNLACPYCFEERFRGSHTMTAETARLLVERVISNHLEMGREVLLRFYGGEPLLALPRLREIAAPLQAAARVRGLPFSCRMVTNGTLLTRPLAEELVALGMQSAQFTLDGPPAIHDRQRPFVSGRGSFAAIMASLKAVYDLLTIDLGGNYTQENWREFPLMLDEVLAAGINPDCLGPVLFAPISPKSGRAAAPELTAPCPVSSEPWLMEAGTVLREETLKRGFRVPKVTMGACMVEFENDLVVNWDGHLYKCPSFLGWPELSVGTLATGVRDYSASHNLAVWQNDECLACAYLPLCFGGCRLIPLLQHGAIDRVDCRRAFYDATLETMIRQDLRYRPAAG